MATLMGWGIPGLYVAVWLVYGWRLTVTILDAQVQRSLRRYPNTYHGTDGVRRLVEEDRPMVIFAGFGLAFFWPVVAPGRGLYRLANLAGLFRTPTERSFAERDELEALRRQARELNLPMPEVKH